MPKPAPTTSAVASAPLVLSSSSASMLSPAEYSHIVQLSSTASPSGTDAAEQHKRALHASSVRRASAWNGSLQAQREAKKEKQALARQQAEEEAGRADRAEEEWKAAEQKRLLDRAHALLYRDRDAVKSLHTSIHLSHTMKQREQQVAWKREQALREQQLDRRLDEQAEQTRQRAVQAAERVDEQRKEARKELAGSQLEQLQQYHAHQQTVLGDEREEGIQTKARQAQAEREMEAEEVRRQEAQRALNSSYQTANQQQQLRRVERAEEEKQHDQLIQRYAADKEATLRSRAEAAEAERLRKAERTQQMLAAQFQHLQAIQHREAARLDRQVEEQAEKARAVELRRERLRKERIAEEADSRQKQMARKRDERDSREAEERARTEQWAVAAAEASEKDRAAARSRRQQAQDTLQQQRQQVADKRDRTRRDEQTEAEQLARQKEEDVKEAARFDAYAAGAIEKLQAEAFSTTPVTLALEAEKIKQTRLKV